MRNDLKALQDKAEELSAAQDWSGAADCYCRIIERDSGNSDALLQLSYLASFGGHYRVARDYALRASATHPSQPAQIVELLSRLRTFNEAGEIHECIDRLPNLRNMLIPLLIAVAAQLSYLNQQEKALRLLDEAKRGDPNYPPTLVARGQVLIYMGRFDEAYADLHHCVERAPALAQAWWLLSRLSRDQERPHRILQIQRLLTLPGRTADTTALLGYALHNELDALGAHDGAWNALAMACAAKRSLLNYKVANMQELTDALIAMRLPQGMVAHDETDAAASRCPIFVVGMHRSGTTLLEQLLDRHHDIRGLGELYDFTHQMRWAADHHCRGVTDATIICAAEHADFAKIGSGYLQGIEWRLGKERFFIDKLPSNFLNIGFICTALPQARILHMRRDPLETCFSNLRELFSDACPYSYDQSELADYYLQYDRLMAHWHRAFPGRILDVDYAQLVQTPEVTLRNILSFAGLDFHSELLNPAQESRGIATASAVQVRSELALPRQPKWHPYRRQLEPLIRGLGHASDPAVGQVADANQGAL